MKRIVNKLNQSQWYKTIKKSGLFNANYYLLNYPDVRMADIDPLKHFIAVGANEGRNPSALFDTLYYLQNNLDVAEAGINPLYHYIQYGKNEGRLPFEDVLTNNVPAPQRDHKEPVEKQESQNDQVSNTNERNTSIVIQPKEFLIEKILFDNTNEGFTEYQQNPPINPTVKTIAFYLPQFHPFPENDEWWGKGFTEWTNVTKAYPNYEGHYQPHLPIHNGFYDLRLPEVKIEQALLAKQYGIYGFAFYYYWFDGKVLMHKPLENLLKHKEIDIPFCFCWANENWTRRWDGQENDVLIAQNHSSEDSTAFIKSLFKYFDDQRYIRIDNKPILIIYRADIIPNIISTTKLWRELAIAHGFPGLYLISAQSFGIKDPRQFDFDASAEFPPHTVQSQIINNELNIINPDFQGRIFDYNKVVENEIKKEEPDYKLFRTCMLSWDNTARKQDNAHIFARFSLLKYKQWFSHIVNKVYNNERYSNEEKIVFINAWNEWAEGTHLEPDRKYGYGYLQTTYSILKKYENNYNEILHKKIKKQNNIAVILHIHYTELWPEIEQYLSNLKTFGFDLYVTITSTENDIIENLTAFNVNTQIRLVENRGRDILPFIETYRAVSRLDYKYICKIHSKKSEYREDGSVIRDELLKFLLGSEAIINAILIKFKDNENLGLITNPKYLVPHTDHNMTYDKEIVGSLSNILKINFDYMYFPAGSMFWFRPEALSGIEELNENHFEIEKGLNDGTIPHAIERLIANIIVDRKFYIQKA